MSEPTRYYAVIPGAGEKEQQDIFHPYGVPFSAHPKGEWVRYEDYARLKAEVEQSKRINTELLVLSERQASDIRRLTKAGDVLHGFTMGLLNQYAVEKARREWEAAKQGGQP